MPPKGVSTWTFFSWPLASLSTWILHPATPAARARQASRPAPCAIGFLFMAIALWPSYTLAGCKRFRKSQAGAGWIGASQGGASGRARTQCVEGPSSLLLVENRIDTANTARMTETTTNGEE